MAQVGAWVVGRDEELGAVESFVADVDAFPAALALEGEPGIGKTTLWRSAVDAARRAGVTVLACSGAANEARLAYAALADLFRGVLDDVAPALPPPQRRALGVALLLEDPEGAPPTPRAVGTACLSALCALAPVVVAIDDVQWLDAASLAALAFAARRLVHEPAAFLVARRRELGATTPRTLEEALGERLQTLTVGPLSTGALHRILRSQLDLTLPRPLLRRLVDTVGGNPYFALEIGRAIRDEGRLDPGMPLPVRGDVRELVRARVRRVSPAARDALLVAAALADPTDDVVETLASRAGLEEALDSGILVHAGRELRFSHPLLAESVYADASDGHRREVHARAAELAAGVEERALHLARAQPGPDEAVAAELEAAGTHASRRGAPLLAAQLLERAAALTPAGDDEGRARRTVASARSYSAAGDEEHARALLRRLLDTRIAGTPRVEALLALAQAMPDRAVHRALCEEALAHAEDDLHRVEVLGALSYAAMHASEFAEAARIDAEAVVLAERSGDADALARSLGAVASMGDITAAPDVDEVVERAISLRRPIPPYNSPVTRKAWLQVARGETSAGRPAIETGYAQAASAGDELQRRWMLVPMTELEWRSGNYEQARVYAQEGVEFAEQLESRHSLSMFHQLRALVDAYRGDVESARASAELALACAHDVGSPFFAARAEIVLGHIELATDDYAAAAGRLGAVDDRLRAGGLVVSGRHFFCYEPDLVEALSGAGRVERTLELGALLAGQRYPVYRATAERARGLAAAARGDNSEALAALRSSLALWETLQVPFERARSRLLLGEAQRRAKARGEARATLLQAQTIFDSIGALRWSERTRAEIARLGGRTRSDAELTPAELRVAQLAGAGKTNKEIAAALFVTVGTVEAALTRVYRKLDVRSRTELARKL